MIIITSALTFNLAADYYVHNFNWPIGDYTGYFTAFTNLYKVMYFTHRIAIFLI